MTLLDAVTAVFPNAGPLWHGQPAEDAIDLEWHDHRILVDAEEVDDYAPTYDVGIYTADGTAPVLFVALPHDPAAVVEYLELISENPEGTDWLAWVAQWTADAIADGRLEAEIVTAA